MFRLARAFDQGDTAYLRLLTPAVKFLICKSVPHAVYESLECLGGNGYTEDLPMARLYREAPLNAIWEGSGNVMALDVLRAVGRAPEAAMETVGALVRTASQAFDARSLPYLVLIGRDGTVQAIHSGFGPGLEERVRLELDAPPRGRAPGGDQIERRFRELDPAGTVGLRGHQQLPCHALRLLILFGHRPDCLTVTNGPCGLGEIHRRQRGGAAGSEQRE